MEQWRVVENQGLKTNIPGFTPGDTVRVMVRVHSFPTRRSSDLDRKSVV